MRFALSPPDTPHVGAPWEREVWATKTHQSGGDRNGRGKHSLLPTTVVVDGSSIPTTTQSIWKEQAVSVITQLLSWVVDSANWGSKANIRRGPFHIKMPHIYWKEIDLRARKRNGESCVHTHRETVCDFITKKILLAIIYILYIVTG